MIADEWIHSLNRVSRRHEARLADVERQADKTARYADWAAEEEGDLDKIRWAEWAAEEAAKTRDQLARVRQQHEMEIAEVLSWRKDPIVLVRSYGSVEVFHSRYISCGWVGAIVRAIPWGQAIKEGKRLCYACGHNAAVSRR